MEKPYIVEVLLKQVEVEVVTKIMEKEAKCPSNVGTLDIKEEVVVHTHEAYEEEVQPISYAKVTMKIGTHLNYISYIILNSFVLEELSNHLADELSSDHNQPAYVSNSEQPTPINIILEPPIEVSSAKPSSTVLVNPT